MTEQAAETTTEQTTTEESKATGDPTAEDIAKLTAALEKERESRKKAEREARDGKQALDKLSELETANASDLEKAVSAARKEAETEAIGRVNTRLVRAEARAAAAEMGFNDPTDVALADLSEVTVGDDGEVDADAVKTALGDLIKVKPHLVKAKTDTSAGDAGIGATGASVTDSSPQGLIRAGLAATSKSK